MPTESEIMGGIGIGSDPYFGEDDDYYQPIRNEPMGNNFQAADFDPPGSPYKYNPLSTNDLITQQIYTNHIKGDNSFSVEADFTRDNMMRKGPNSPVAPIYKENFENETEKKCGCSKCRGGNSMFNMSGNNMILLFFLFMIFVILMGNSIMLSGRVNSLTKTIMKLGTKKQ